MIDKLPNWEEVKSANPALSLVGQNPHRLAKFVLTSGVWQLKCDEVYYWQLKSLFSPKNCPNVEMAARLVLDILECALKETLQRSELSGKRIEFKYELGEFIVDAFGMKDAPGNFPMQEMLEIISALEVGVPLGHKHNEVLSRLIKAMQSSPMISGIEEALAESLENDEFNLEVPNTSPVMKLFQIISTFDQNSPTYQQFNNLMGMVVLSNYSVPIIYGADSCAKQTMNISSHNTSIMAF